MESYYSCKGGIALEGVCLDLRYWQSRQTSFAVGCVAHPEQRRDDAVCHGRCDDSEMVVISLSAVVACLLPILFTKYPQDIDRRRHLFTLCITAVNRMLNTMATLLTLPVVVITMT